MDIAAETIQKVLDISAPKIHLIPDTHGVEANYSTKQLHQVEAAAPKLPPLVEVNTLCGFADLVRAKLETKNFPADFLIHVEAFDTISLKARQSDEYGRRQVLVIAKPVPFKQFAFGQWYDQESFAIALMSLFADSPDRDYVLKMASTLTNESTSISEDDGVSQKATVKAGLRTKENVTLKPRVNLAPYRTFPEVEQPLSQFIFRARMTGDTPALMLVEADGGRWKVEAIANLRSEMDAFSLTIPIIA